MGNFNNLTEQELLGTFCLLDNKSIELLRTLFANDIFHAVAPRLAVWIVEEITNEQQRRLTGIEGSPAPLDLDDWSDAEIGDALDGCLLLQPPIDPQDDLVSLLTNVVSKYAIERLKSEAEQGRAGGMELNSGEDCPRCDGRIQVVNTFVFGQDRIRYLGCRSCGFRPESNCRRIFRGRLRGDFCRNQPGVRRGGSARIDRGLRTRTGGMREQRAVLGIRFRG